MAASNTAATRGTSSGSQPRGADGAFPGLGIDGQDLHHHLVANLGPSPSVQPGQRATVPVVNEEDQPAPGLGAWSLLYHSIFRESDGYEALLGFEDSGHTVQESIAQMRERIDNELAEDDPLLESESEDAVPLGFRWPTPSTSPAFILARIAKHLKA